MGLRLVTVKVLNSYDYCINFIRSGKRGKYPANGNKKNRGLICPRSVPLLTAVSEYYDDVGVKI